MAYLIEDRKFINENVFKFEQRMESQYTRFLDKSPTFVTYYGISGTTTTTDSGLFNVEQILGSNSPLKYKKIEDFPIYGIEAILLTLNEEEQGLDASFDSDGTILPNTIVPLPNDLFTVSYLNKDYLFMITSVSYDFIKSHNFYKIEYTLRSVTPEQLTYLDRQIDEKYTCIFRNIGTEDKCLIKTDDFMNMVELNRIFKKLSDRYLHTFYHKKYNCFIFQCPNQGNKIYDSFLNHFIDKHELFNEKFNYKTIQLSNEDYSDRFESDYDMSWYTTLEQCNLAQVPDHIIFTLKPITGPDSVFDYYRDINVKAVFFFPLVNNKEYLDPILLDSIKSNIRLDGDNILRRIIIDYFNKKLTNFNDFDIKELDDLPKYFAYDFDVFHYVPMVMYIIRTYYQQFIKTNN